MKLATLYRSPVLKSHRSMRNGQKARRLQRHSDAMLTSLDPQFVQLRREIEREQVRRLTPAEILTLWPLGYEIPQRAMWTSEIRTRSNVKQYLAISEDD